MIESKPDWEWAREALSSGLHWYFSPSGLALTFRSFVRENALGCVEVRYADGREPTILLHDDLDCLVWPHGWLSDDEVLYYVSGKPLGTNETSTLRAFSISSGQTRRVSECENLRIGHGGKSGFFSVIEEVGENKTLMELDGTTGKLRHRAEFDAALSGLTVYPLFGHSLSPTGQEVALIGWPTGDYLPPNMPFTDGNSQWNPMLDTPWIQDYVTTRADGSQVTQRELTQEAKRKTPPRLFLLNTLGDCVEVPGTYHADNPLWSADGTLLSFERFVARKDASPTHRLDGVWLMRRDDLSLMRLGACPLTPSAIMHPSGVLFCHLEDERALPDPTNRLWRRPSRWHTFAVQNGEVRPL